MDYLHFFANLLLAGGLLIIALLLFVFIRRTGTALYYRKRTRSATSALAAFIGVLGFIFSLEAFSVWWPTDALGSVFTLIAAGLVWVCQMLMIPIIQRARDITSDEAVESLTQRVDHLIETLTPFAEAIRKVEDGKGRSGGTG